LFTLLLKTTNIYHMNHKLNQFDTHGSIHWQVKHGRFFKRLLPLNFLGLGPHLFVKVPRPGDSEITFSVFEKSCYLLLPV